WSSDVCSSDLDDLEAPAGKAHRLAFNDPVAVQVRLLPDTAGCAYPFDQTGSDRAAVETIQTPLTDGAQGGGQLRLTNQLPGRRSLIVPEKDTRRFRILLHGLQAETDQGAVTLAHRKTFLGGGHRRRQALLQGQLAVVLCQMHQRRRQTGNARSQWPIDHPLQLVVV